MVSPTQTAAANLFSLEGKTALVTGGTAGLGLNVTRGLIEAGVRVLVTSRRPDPAVVEELTATGRCEVFAANVATEEGVAEIVSQTRARTDRLEILFNNAGISWGADYETFPWSAWEKVFAVNVTGLFALTRDLTPLLEASARPFDPARVVNMGSVVGTLPITGRAFSYSASKAAVHHLTKMLAGYLSGRNITVNAIAPGPFESRMTAFALQDDEARAYAENGIPMGRMGAPEDLLGTLTYLCSRAGAYTTGAIIPLDGGISTIEPPPLWDPSAS